VSLGTDGTLGVKTVNAENIVEFFAIQVVKAQIDGIWVTGLPDVADVITVGQGYVNEGEIIDPDFGDTN
jgi:multidrug efflux system membrane fusion protein